MSDDINAKKSNELNNSVILENNGAPATTPQNYTSMYEKAMNEKRKKSKEKKDCYEKISVEHNLVIKKILILNIIIALFATFFFAGDNSGYIGLFSFTSIVSLLLLVFLFKENLVENKKAFLWLVPINLIAFSNALFMTNLHYLNIIVIHILFSVMFIQATNTDLKDIFDFTLYISSIKNFIPNFILTNTLFNKGILPQIKNNSLSNLKKIIIGLCLVAPIMFVVLILLSVADKNFAEIVFENSFNLPSYFNKLVYFIIATIIFFLYSSKIIYSKYTPTTEVKKFGFDGIIFSTSLFCLNFIYLIFIYIQAKYFITDGLMVLPEGFTYAEYATHGFQCTFLVTLINFGIIVFVTELTKIKFDNTLFKLNFGLIFLTNTLLIFTAFIRTYMYMDVYGYTSTRLSVILVLLLQFIIMILLLCKIIFKIQFYKVATFVVLGIYLVQAYFANDYVTTYLNFQKFNITSEDIENSDLIAYQVENYEYDDRIYIDEKPLFYTVTTESSEHTLSFPINIDSSAFLWKVAPEKMEEEQREQTMTTRNPYINGRNFFSKTIFERNLEKIYNQTFVYPTLETSTESI